MVALFINALPWTRLSLINWPKPNWATHSLELTIQLNHLSICDQQFQPSACHFRGYRPEIAIAKFHTFSVLIIVAYASFWYHYYFPFIDSRTNNTRVSSSKCPVNSCSEKYDCSRYHSKRGQMSPNFVSHIENVVSSAKHIHDKLW